jgi:hypothetical protein
MEVRHLLEAQRVFMVGIVFAELLRGARTEEQFGNLAHNLGSLPFLDMTKTTWGHAGRILSDLQRQGIGIAVPDAAIAALALEYDVPVYSRDAHFQRVEGLVMHIAEES